MGVEQEIKVKLNSLENMLPAQLREIWEKIKLLSSLLCDYIDGRYRGNISAGKIAEIAAALLYLVLPMDLIFDGIPLVGFSDDLIVLGRVLDSVLEELEVYRIWREGL